MSAGARELLADTGPTDRVRGPGAGRPSAREADPDLAPALLSLVEPLECGDPETPLRWTVKSTRNLAVELTAAGHPVSHETVASLLKAEGFSLQGTHRTTEGARHPDRDAQFRYISDTVASYLEAGDPVVSVDAKKKEVLGDYAVAGATWRPAGNPVDVRAHDFPDKDAPKAVPYGVYDLAANTGWVSVGCDADTAEFAVATLTRWWRAEGRARYPQAKRLLITADAGGSNGYRVRAWKRGLHRFARQSGVEVTVLHFPPGTSKWNKIEHRLFAQISSNWRGRPLTGHEAVVSLIGATTTRTGLTVTAELDPAAYPVGVRIPAADVDRLPLDRHDWHGEWNYTLRPSPAGAAPDPAFGRFPEGDKHPAWLRHPAISGFTDQEWEVLVERYRRHLAEHPTTIPFATKPAGNTGARLLSTQDRLLVAVLKRRWKLAPPLLAELFGVSQGTVRGAVREAGSDLDVLGVAVEPGPHRPATAEEFRAAIPAASAIKRHNETRD
ncbi:Mobile element protein [Nocardiopsis sp. JB363]|nr:Mobile element protein [Nocardiopsis sp. JB363]